MIVDINEHIALARELRRKHLNLTTSCDLRGVGSGGSKEFRGLLAHFLGTTIPSGRWIILCHACHNKECSNPLHLYWGTPKDNHVDQVENGTAATIFERLQRKYSKDELKEVLSRGGKKNAGKVSPRKITNAEVKKRKLIISKYDRNIRGWLGQCATELGISHTQLRRFLLQHD